MPRELPETESFLLLSRVDEDDLSARTLEPKSGRLLIRLQAEGEFNPSTEFDDLMDGGLIVRSE